VKLLSGSTEKFQTALTNAKYDLPPLAASWRLTDSNVLSLKLTNLRTAALNGRISLAGADFVNPSGRFEIKAGGMLTLEFKAISSLNRKELSLKADTNLGQLTSAYRAELLPCPPLGNFNFAGKALPSKGRLPLMDSRDYIIPNDPNNGYDGADDLSVESAITYDSEKLYLAINVKDDVHFQKSPAASLWFGDSVQLAIDTLADAMPNVYQFDANDYEFSFGLNQDGAQKNIDTMYERGRVKQALESVESNVFREGNLTIYRIAIPWKTLKLTPRKGMIFGLNFIVNDNDGLRRGYWMGLTPGIGETKNPYAYRKFILE
jgi:hypothetical protein